MTADMEHRRSQRRAYELRMAGTPWHEITELLEFASKEDARLAADKYRRRHNLPGFTQAAPVPSVRVPREGHDTRRR